MGLYLLDSWLGYATVYQYSMNVGGLHGIYVQVILRLFCNPLHSTTIANCGHHYSLCNSS